MLGASKLAVKPVRSSPADVTISARVRGWRVAVELQRGRRGRAGRQSLSLAGSRGEVVAPLGDALGLSSMANRASVLARRSSRSQPPAAR